MDACERQYSGSVVGTTGNGGHLRMLCLTSEFLIQIRDFWGETASEKRVVFCPTPWDRVIEVKAEGLVRGGHGRRVFLGVEFFPGGSDGKESSCNVGDLGSIPGLQDPLEEGMATHSSIFAWRIPMDRGAWQAIPMGLQRVGHNWNDLAHTHLSYIIFIIYNTFYNYVLILW